MGLRDSVQSLLVTMKPGTIVPVGELFSAAKKRFPGAIWRDLVKVLRSIERCGGGNYIEGRRDSASRFEILALDNDLMEVPTSWPDIHSIVAEVHSMPSQGARKYCLRELIAAHMGVRPKRLTVDMRIHLDDFLKQQGIESDVLDEECRKVWLWRTADPGSHGYGLSA